MTTAMNMLMFSDTGSYPSGKQAGAADVSKTHKPGWQGEVLFFPALKLNLSLKRSLMRCHADILWYYAGIYNPAVNDLEDCRSVVCSEGDRVTETERAKSTVDRRGTKMSRGQREGATWPAAAALVAVRSTNVNM